MGMRGVGNWTFNPTESSICPAINLPSFYPSVHLLIQPFTILARGQRAMSLCGPDNLDQFPLQFISQPTTHLVKQHQASQGSATHPSKLLPTNHILFFPPQASDLFCFKVSIQYWSNATFPPFFTVNGHPQQPLFTSNVLTLLRLCFLLSSSISIGSALFAGSPLSLSFSLPPSILSWLLSILLLSCVE